MLASLRFLDSALFRSGFRFVSLLGICRSFAPAASAFGIPHVEDTRWMERIGKCTSRDLDSEANPDSVASLLFSPFAKVSTPHVADAVRARVSATQESEGELNGLRASDLVLATKMCPTAGHCALSTLSRGSITDGSREATQGTNHAQEKPG